MENTVKEPKGKVWHQCSDPGHIVKWNTPSEYWHASHTENDLREGGSFLSRMEAKKDGCFGFDFEGTYDEVVLLKRIAYTLGDSRQVEVDFEEECNDIKIVSTFDA